MMILAFPVLIENYQDLNNKLIKGNRYWNSDIRVAENCPLTYYSNPPKGSWGLRKLIVTGPQEHKSTVKTACYVIRW